MIYLLVLGAAVTWLITDLIKTYLYVLTAALSRLRKRIKKPWTPRLKYTANGIQVHPADKPKWIQECIKEDKDWWERNKTFNERTKTWEVRYEGPS